MSIQSPPLAQPVARPPAERPPLNPGDHLTLMEFQRRYEAHPEIKKAELLEGVVYMPSPTRADHSQLHALAVAWLVTYAAATPGTAVGDNATVRLSHEDEVQPDVLLRLEREAGGKVRLTSDHYLEGPPELVVEVAASSASYDLHVKRRVYARSGVQEYVVVQVYERRVQWFTLQEQQYEALHPDDDGILRSKRFAGLWLHPAALLEGDAATLLRVVQAGLRSPEHAAFAARL